MSEAERFIEWLEEREFSNWWMRLRPIDYKGYKPGNEYPTPLMENIPQTGGPMWMFHDGKLGRYETINTGFGHQVEVDGRTVTLYIVHEVED